jgi:CubicO group peptidase (beta-lactamase class C family)
MCRWKILAATALAAATAVLPVSARELQPLATATPEQVGMSVERLGRITTMLKKEIADGKLPGAVVMVARKGKIVYSDAIGFQDKGAETPMKLDSIFRVYSMTKPLVSVAAVMLVEDGVIQLTQIPAGLQRHASERGKHRRRWQDHLHECTGGQADHRAGPSAA